MAAILVIDDDSAVRLMVRRVLERSGHDVRVAHDGAEGMKLMRAAPADLVITDLYMPTQDGIETIQLVRDEFPAARILAMSGGAAAPGTGLLLDAEMFGADATLAKPFTMDRLSRVVNSLLDRNG